MTDSNGRNAFETLSKYVDEHGWNALPIEGETAFKATRQEEPCSIDYYFQIKIEFEQFLFYIAPVVRLLPDMLPRMAEFVCRANHGLRIGNFELDFNDGQLTFKSSVNFKGVPLTFTLIDNTVQPALTAFKELFPAAAQVVADLKSPAKAIREAEYDW